MPSRKSDQSHLWMLMGTLLVILFLVFFMETFAKAEQDTTVEGRINMRFQLVTYEGVVYEIAETRIGDKMARLQGRKVRATGPVSVIEDGTRILTVVSFDELLEDHVEETIKPAPEETQAERKNLNQ